MARRWLRGCAFPALLRLSLLLLLRPPVTPATTCPTPVSVEHADIQVKSYNLNSRERYVCNSGFKRKAGTSSLTECVFNSATNTTHWTTPSLKCIRDPSLTHQRPVPLSTVVTPRVTPQPESPSPSEKEPAVDPKSDTPVATETTAVPGSPLILSRPPSTGTTGRGSHESSQAPAQTTAETLLLPPSTSQETPDVYAESSRNVILTVSTSVTVLCVLCGLSFLVWYTMVRRPSRPLAVEMETMEAVPMTAGAGSREEGVGNYPQDL